MLRGLYTATAGMLSQQRKHDAITNNIANLNTPGFKQSQTVIRSFPEMLIRLMEEQPGGGATVNWGRLHSGVLAEEAMTVHIQGDLRETGNPLDFAIVSDIQTGGVTFNNGKAITPDGERVFQPQAFFTVLNADGEERYTRNGQFTVNELGQLVTAEGFPVLGLDRQPIVLVDPATQEPLSGVTVDKRGFLLHPATGEPLTDAAGNPVGLLLSRVENPNRLIPEGLGLYRIAPGDEANVAPVNPDDQVQVFQGFVEGSNVDPVQSMVDMMTASRLYEANQKVIQAYDRSLEKAANEVGRV